MSRKWLNELQEKVADCWAWHSPALQIGFRYAKPDENDDFWEIWAYPAVQEIVGGKEDGETVWSGFNFDVLAFLKDFEADEIGIRALLIHAKDESAREFYMKCAEFEPSPTDPLHLFLLMKDLRKSLANQG